MKNTVVVLIFGFFSLGAFAASPAALLKRPLILGASISAGTHTTGPATRAALRYTTRDRIQNQAVRGSYGKDFSGFYVDYFRTRTIVIGIDLLFWDATLDNEHTSLANLERLVSTAQRAGVPVLIGDVPALTPWPYQMKCRDKMNSGIARICRPSRGCRVLPFARMYQKLQKTPIRYHDNDYTWPGFSDDGLHVNATGSEYLADLIVAAIRRM